MTRRRTGEFRMNNGTNLMHKKAEATINREDNE